MVLVSLFHCIKLIKSVPTKRKKGYLKFHKNNYIGNIINSDSPAFIVSISNESSDVGSK